MCKRLLGAAFVLVMLFSTSTLAFAKKHDLEYWHNEGIVYKIAKDWKLGFSEEAYLNDNASHYYYEDLDINVTYSGIAKWFDLGLSFKHIITESNNRWRREERPNLNATLRYTYKGFGLSSRNRFEYRIREDAEDTGRYRNLMTIRLPWKFTKKEIRPYIAEEVIVDFDKKQLNENRVYAGFTFNITKEFAADIYYLMRRVKTTSITNSDIVGTKLTYTF